MHQKPFFHSIVTRTSASDTGVPLPTRQNDQQYHANKVYHMWRSKGWKEVYSNRLGI